jgi:hypothetical protein
MGRSSLDLRQVQLEAGEQMVVDVFVTMGRATVRIPDHWVVDASALPVMGSVDEERFTPLPEAPATPGTDQAAGDAAPSPPPALPSSGPKPRLKLRGFVLMGKVEVTS